MGITELLMQYFKKGLVVAARNRKCLLKSTNVVTFQLMMNIPTASPTRAVEKGLTVPRYSGARYNESAPKFFIKVPFTVLNNTNHNTSRAWYFLKCRNKS
jgi:hypothetical protein